VSDSLPSSPHFFRLIGRSMLLCVLALLLLSALFPAPLQAPADPAHPPNPAKSAWFLLWIQELVSHDSRLVLVAVALAALLVALPWLGAAPLEHAVWFPREHRAVALVTLLASALVLALTIVGLLLRGPDWRLVLPF
jgi:hypothetical protein